MPMGSLRLSARSSSMFGLGLFIILPGYFSRIKMGFELVALYHCYGRGVESAVQSVSISISDPIVSFPRTFVLPESQ